MSKISLIAAVARNNVIGADQSIPWRIPSDFAWFKQTTMGKPMVMGRKQFETFAKPLPGRPHIVVTRQHDYRPDGVLVRHSLQEALAAARRLAEASEQDEIMVIGGGDIYAQALPLADRLYISHVDLEPDGDVHFPPIDPAEWRVVDEPGMPRSERDAATYTIRVYQRIHGSAH
ncbi:dihydrofolate reductase [Devosia subaequoris]|uniref:Dihydrofolate reductase n=1 Tax=Devosia subaequoris TaxID=395930 RepID=A0A7W6IL26_9HYPH|nr:dihydrofolate reductase [Devosia subaequoris]MBB4051587.1 dihydrofolate reductase [Devosia subaequoris]MCP1209179.1 dihydrofolate reductase [Devosia subaequoris]